MKRPKLLLYTIILIFLIFFVIFISPKLYLERQIRDSGKTTQAVVLGMEKGFGFCALRFSYKAPMPDGKIKGFVEKGNVPCSSEVVYKNLRFGSEIAVKYLPLAPEKSIIEGNPLIGWQDVVRALGATISLVGLSIFFKIMWPLEQQFSIKNIIVGTIAWSVAGASFMIALGGLEYIASVPLIVVVMGAMAPFFIIARWINYKLYSFIQNKLSAKPNKN